MYSYTVWGGLYNINMHTSNDIHKRMDRAILWLVLAAAAFATEVASRECYTGQERDHDGQLQWLVTEKDPDGCTEFRPGGLNIKRQVKPYEVTIGQVGNQQTVEENKKDFSFVTRLSQGDTYTFMFILRPLTMPFRLDFTLKSKKDALIALAENKTRESIFADINIGGWSNTKAVIRACHSSMPICGAFRAEYNLADGFISSNEFRPFWIEYIEGVVTVGKGGREEGFMHWNVSEYHGRIPSDVHVGIASHAVEDGMWKFLDFWM